jgi:hypothetical protein
VKIGAAQRRSPPGQHHQCRISGPGDARVANAMLAHRQNDERSATREFVTNEDAQKIAQLLNFKLDICRFGRPGPEGSESLSLLQIQENK